MPYVNFIIVDDKDIIGYFVLKVNISEDELRFEFSEKKNFHISLKSADYNSPEAFELHTDGSIREIHTRLSCPAAPGSRHKK
jgi:hypothetical protein